MAYFKNEIILSFRLAGADLKTPVVQKTLSPGSKTNIGSISNGGNRLYVSMTLEFQIPYKSQSYQNLLQTAPGNDGIRIELHESTIAAIIANHDKQDQPIILLVSNRVVPGQWHRLIVTAIDKDFVSVTLDDVNRRIDSKSIRVSGTDLRLGVGFDDSRTFDGKIRNASVKHAVASQSAITDLLYWCLISTLLIALVIQAYLSFWQDFVDLWRRIVFPFWKNFVDLWSRKKNVAKRFVEQNNKEGCIETRDCQASLWIASGIGTVLALATYVFLVFYLRKNVGAVVSSLLPGYAQTPDGGAIKGELIAFVLLQFAFITVLSVFWIGPVFFRRHMSIKLPPPLALLLPLLGIVAIFLVHGVLLRILLVLATGFFAASILASFAAVRRIGFVLTIAVFSLSRGLIRFRRSVSRLSNRSLFIRRLAYAGIAPILGLVLLWPAVQAWYPMVLPNDYYEVQDRFQIEGAAGITTSTREEVERCLTQPSKPTACDGTKDPSNAFISSSHWQSAIGRLFFHHSYVFVPANHWIAHGLDNAVPYLYGYGNTIFHGLLMAALGGGLGDYFASYPLALLTGLLIIAACVGYGVRSLWLSIAAFLICLNALYTIDFSASFLAASFSPLRYAGLALQIASVFFCLRGRPKRIAILPMIAVLSLFWNTEFGVLGLVGQSLLLLSPQLRLPYLTRMGVLLTLVATLFAFYAVSRPSADIVSTIFLGFFQINMPIMRPWEIGLFFFCVFVIQAIVTLVTFTFKGTERAARLCVLPVIALTLIKAIFNPSPPHMSITLAFILPMALLFLPRPTLINLKERSALFSTIAKSLTIMILALTCWNSGSAYLAQAKEFKSLLIEPYVSEPWASLGETLPVVVPEAPIADRVAAIAEIMRPEDTLLILSPFDHILSFYANPIRYCGHFELISNIATQKNIDEVVDCVARSPTMLLVFDQSLLMPCPNLTTLGVETECGKKLLVKNNVAHIFERLLPNLEKVGSKGELTFYRKRSTVNTPVARGKSTS